jgi:hypothetical protein
MFTIDSTIEKRRKIEAEEESKSQPVISRNQLEISQSRDEDQVMHAVNRESTR